MCNIDILHKADFVYLEQILVHQRFQIKETICLKNWIKNREIWIRKKMTEKFNVSKKYNFWIDPIFFNAI